MYRKTALGMSVGIIAVTLLIAGQVQAEPSIHYANAPRVLPAPIIYERAEQTSVSYSDSPSYVAYRRTYSQPACTTERVVQTVPAVRYTAEPVFYARTYGVPERVVHVHTGSYYHSPRAYHYYRPYRWYAPPVYRTHHHRPAFFSHHYAPRPRGWGFGLGYGRGYHGHRHGAFSFYLNR